MVVLSRVLRFSILGTIRNWPVSLERLLRIVLQGADAIGSTDQIIVFDALVSSEGEQGVALFEERFSIQLVKKNFPQLCL
jgi:hypothetical protein